MILVKKMIKKKKRLVFKSLTYTWMNSQHTRKKNRNYTRKTQLRSSKDFWVLAWMLKASDNILVRQCSRVASTSCTVNSRLSPSSDITVFLIPEKQLMSFIKKKKKNLCHTLLGLRRINWDPYHIVVLGEVSH